MDQPGMVANPARRRLNRENAFFSVPVRASEFGLARQIRPSRPASACSFYTLGLNLVLTEFSPLSAAASTYTNRHRVSPEFIESRNGVPIAFTA